ncbi:alpha/beta fold hydrolase [Nioella aestuarii]|uniref:alpha/beta fold hydrolase n=1 Tax=Nioella aestuarii TaxID=1662864 RepID=UPI003D7F677E
MTFSFLERGKGPPVLFLPGSFSTTAAWSGVWDALPDGFCLLSANLPGYAGADDPRIASDNSMARLTDWLFGCLDQIAEPVHLVGHSFGGQIAIAAMLQDRRNVLSLTTFEANPVFVKPLGQSFPWLRDVQEIAPRLAQAHARNDADAAGIVIDYWTEAGTFAAMPERIRDFCNSGVATNLRDWDSARSFDPEISAFQDIDLPATFSWGSRASKPIADACSAIAREWPNCATRIIQGANHFLITSHPEDCAAVIVDRIRGCEAG